jgi:gamma-glutamylcyclotransferase (GGCT)/AIG2-like uncharacterized protein YtfP
MQVDVKWMAIHKRSNMAERTSTAANLWQSREMRPYLVKSISRFNEARVYSDENAKIKACETILDGLDALRTGLLDELVVAVEYDQAVFRIDLPFLWGLIERLFDYPVNRLAIYGTLRRGGANHRIIEHIAGEWTEGFVCGRIEKYYGFPFFIWDEGGDKIPVEVLSSSELCESWERIDRFEGVWYHRNLIPVYDSVDNILFIANIYCKSGMMYNPGLLHR